MTTGRDLIKSTFRLLGIYEAGENPTAEEANDALQALNYLKDSLNLNNLISYQTLSQTYPFIADQASYVFGSGGDFNITVPSPQITNVTIRDISNQLDLPCKIITDKDYADIVIKDLESPIPFYVMIETQSNNSKRLTFWPIPQQTNYGATIYYQAFIPAFTLDDEITLPYGFLRLLRYQLAIEIAPEYGVSVSSEVAMVANESLANVKRQNFIPQTIGVDPAIRSSSAPYNYTYADLVIGS